MSGPKAITGCIKQKKPWALHAMMASTLRFYHNPRCSKSREAKQILDESGNEYETVLYLDEPPSLTQLRRIAKSIPGGAASLLRTKEAREEGWDSPTDVSDKEILEFLAEHPRAIQRPIVVHGERAVVGRPPERIKEIL